MMSFYKEKMSHPIAYKIGPGIAVALFLLLMPLFVSEINIHLAIEIIIYSLFAISFNLLVGYGGMLPFGHAAFFGIGAYVTSFLIRHLPEIHILLPICLTAFSCVIVAAFIGFFCVRFKGATFAILSLGFQMFFFAAASKWRAITNGYDGITISRPDLYLPVIGNISMGNIINFYYLTLIVVTLGVMACFLFLKTPLGNSLICTRENEMRVSFLGYNPFLTKFVAFSASGALAGPAGGLFILFQQYVNTSCIDINMSLMVVMMTIIGGSSRFFGPVLGVAFYMIFQDWVSSLTDHWWILLGIVFIIIILYFEGGLISLFTEDKIRILMKAVVSPIKNWRKNGEYFKN